MAIQRVTVEAMRKADCHILPCLSFLFVGHLSRYPVNRKRVSPRRDPALDRVAEDPLTRSVLAQALGRVDTSYRMPPLRCLRKVSEVRLNAFDWFLVCLCP